MEKVVVLKSKTPKVYKSNKLNNANFGDFNHSDYQVFLTLLSKIGGVDGMGKYLQAEKLKREYVLTASEFSNIFNTATSNCYVALKKAVNRLMKTDVRIHEPGANSYVRINICSRAEYMEKEGKISVKFTDDIMPYLVQVKKKFLLYNLREVSNFGSLYTTRLYELLQEFKETGWMVKSIEQLKEAFAVGTKYKQYGHFKSKTFGPACEEINKNYDINLEFEEIKDGKKIVAIKFFFKRATIHQVTHQHTCETRKLYEKPKRKFIAKKERGVATKKPKNVESFPRVEAQPALEPIAKKSMPLSKFFSSLFGGYFKK